MTAHATRLVWVAASERRLRHGAARTMTSERSLFACAAADVTLDRVRQLVAQDLQESLTLEFKERFSPRFVTGIAAMANSYGRIILVGITDRRELRGVSESALAQVVSACCELEPPWEPEIIPVRVGEPISSSS